MTKKNVLAYNKPLDLVLNNFKAITDSLIIMEGDGYISARDSVGGGRLMAFAKVPDVRTDPNELVGFVNFPMTCLIPNLSDFASIYKSISGNVKFGESAAVIANDSTSIKYQYGIFPNDMIEVRSKRIDISNLPPLDDSTLVYAANIMAKDFKMIESANQYLRYSNFFYSIEKDTGSFSGRDIKDGQTIATTNTFTHKVDCVVNRLPFDIILKSTDFCFLPGDYVFEVHMTKIPADPNNTYIMCRAVMLDDVTGLEVTYLITFQQRWNDIQLGAD